MNKERMQEVRDFIAGLDPEQVYMEQWCLPRSQVELDECAVTISTHAALNRDLNECETAACVAGWTTILFKDEAKVLLSKNEFHGFSDLARSILGLTWEQATDLFTPDIDNSEQLNNKELVVAVLDNMLVYGKPQWCAVAEQLGIELVSCCDE